MATTLEQTNTLSKVSTIVSFARKNRHAMASRLAEVKTGSQAQDTRYIYSVGRKWRDRSRGMVMYSCNSWLNKPRNHDEKTCVITCGYNVKLIAKRLSKIIHWWHCYGLLLSARAHGQKSLQSCYFYFLLYMQINEWQISVIWLPQFFFVMYTSICQNQKK